MSQREQARRKQLLTGLRAAAEHPHANAELRSAIGMLLQRADFAELAGQSFGGKRNIYDNLGYQKTLKPTDYRGRYNRGGIAKRIVEAFPRSTWRGGGELVEDQDPDNETEFEAAFAAQNKRLNVWSTFERADILAGLGQYSIILLGAPGNLDTPLKKGRPEDLKYITPFSQRDVVYETLVEKPEDERFGLPTYYNIRRLTATGLNASPTRYNGARVHYSRIIHIADGLLDDPLLGTPRLQAVWNYLDDLEKIVGGGAEAFWKKADRGMHIKIDPTLTVTGDMRTELEDKVEEYTHRLKRNLTTQGVELTPLQSDVAQFSPQVASLLDLISATIEIPQRTLMGSERGQLASGQDKMSFDDRVQDRRDQFAHPIVVRQYIERCQQFGFLPECEDWETRWPEGDELDEMQKMDLAKKAADTNRAQGETVFTYDEIREMVGKDPLADVDPDAAADNDADPEPLIGDDAIIPGNGGDPNELKIRAMSAKRQRWMKLKKRKSKGNYW